VPAGLLVLVRVPGTPKPKVPFNRSARLPGDAAVGARGAAGPRRARFCPRCAQLAPGSAAASAALAALTDAIDSSLSGICSVGLTRRTDRLGRSRVQHSLGIIKRTFQFLYEPNLFIFN
jgi:hypothetical protein